jgi:hypothetical protein
VSIGRQIGNDDLLLADGTGRIVGVAADLMRLPDIEVLAVIGGK